MFEAIILCGVALVAMVIVILEVKEGQDPYKAEKEYYRKNGEFPSYVYDVMQRSGQTEEEVKDLMGL